MLISITFPFDRRKLGTINVKDKNNRIILNSFCLGLSDETYATSFNNIDKNPLMRGGNTPLGQYKCTIELFKQPATEQELHSYGPEGLIHLEAVGGDALIACGPLNEVTRIGGRTGICIHNGLLNPAYLLWKGLRPTFGCVRVFEDIFKLIVDTSISTEDTNILCTIL